jgi:catechol 2,3-dioxygenase-like lactoylglutathione lyase family enzyme
MHLDHVVLRARDVGRLVRFYCDVLGCRLEREVPDLGLFQLRAGSALIDVVAAAGSLGRAGGAPPAPDRGHNVDHICLRIEPFEPRALLAHLVAHGVTASEVRRVYGAEGLGPSVYIDDPEGNTVELKGPAGAAAP